MVRYLADKWHRKSAGDDDSSPAVLLSSGYIAGGAIAAVLVSFMNFSPSLTEWFETKGVSISESLPSKDLFAFLMFLLLTVCLMIVGMRKAKEQ